MKKKNVLNKFICAVMVGTMLLSTAALAEPAEGELEPVTLPYNEIIIDGGSVILHFDSKGGTECKPISVGVGVSPTCRYELPTPTRRGYTFVGWFTKDGKKVNSEQGSLCYAFARMYCGEEGTVYAKWLINTAITDITVNKGENISISWKKRKAPDKYEVQIATNKKFKDARTITTNKNSVRIKYQKKYASQGVYVRVRTIKKIGNKTYKSVWRSSHK